jgi:hypothetical protein
VLAELIAKPEIGVCIGNETPEHLFEPIVPTSNSYAAISSKLRLFARV